MLFQNFPGEHGWTGKMLLVSKLSGWKYDQFSLQKLRASEICPPVGWLKKTGFNSTSGRQSATPRLWPWWRHSFEMNDDPIWWPTIWVSKWFQTIICMYLYIYMHMILYIQIDTKWWFQRFVGHFLGEMLRFFVKYFFAQPPKPMKTLKKRCFLCWNATRWLACLLKNRGKNLMNLWSCGGWKNATGDGGLNQGNFLDWTKEFLHVFFQSNEVCCCFLAEGVQF